MAGDGKPSPAQSNVSSIPMSLLMPSGHHGVTPGQGLEGVSVLGSAGRPFPKGAIPVITNPVLSASIPASLAPGKGVILQVPIGSKLVSAIPATTMTLNKQKSTIPVSVTSSVFTSSLITPVMTQGSPATATGQAGQSTEGLKSRFCQG